MVINKNSFREVLSIFHRVTPVKGLSLCPFCFVKRILEYPVTDTTQTQVVEVWDGSFNEDLTTGVQGH